MSGFTYSSALNRGAGVGRGSFTDGSSSYSGIPGIGRSRGVANVRTGTAVNANSSDFSVGGQRETFNRSGFVAGRGTSSSYATPVSAQHDGYGHQMRLEYAKKLEQEKQPTSFGDYSTVSNVPQPGGFSSNTSSGWDYQSHELPSNRQSVTSTDYNYTSSRGRGRGKIASNNDNSSDLGFSGGFSSGFSCEGGFNSVPSKQENADFDNWNNPSTNDRDRKSGFGGIFQRTLELKAPDTTPVLREFYKESPEITAMSAEEVAEYRASRNNISVIDIDGARHPPKPVKTFEQALMHYPEILEEIRKQNFKEPSPIQSQMWPVALSGYDTIGIAQTGTGKTLAFLVPALIHLAGQPNFTNPDRGVGCLILSPTRELTIQTHAEVKKYHYKGIKSACIYGGAPRSHQAAACEGRVDIIIATPGRLYDLMSDKTVNLSTVSFLVLDEADRMLDMGFEPQINLILQYVRKDRLTVLTSATWPESVREMAKRYTKDAFLVFVGSLDLSAVHSITQQICVVADEQKREYLIDFLGSLESNEKVIVFVGRKASADWLCSDLNDLSFSCQAIHGDRYQDEREKALSDFKAGRVRILIATDVASRGLDIGDITHVYNFDFPRNMEEYVHRVGRTGRAGKRGVSITLMTRSDWHQSTKLIKILEEANQEVPDDLVRMSERYEAKMQERGMDTTRRPERQRRERSGACAFTDPISGETFY